MPASASASASISRRRQSSARLPSRPCSCRKRLAALRIGVGVDQIGETFDGGEVELAVLERAARELAGLGRAQAVHRCERREQRGDHRASAMQLDLGDVLARFAFRSGKKQRQRLVDDLARLRIADARERRAGAAPEFFRSVLSTRRRRADRKCAPPRPRPAGGRRRARRWCRAGQVDIAIQHKQREAHYIACFGRSLFSVALALKRSDMRSLSSWPCTAAMAKDPIHAGSLQASDVIGACRASAIRAPCARDTLRGGLFARLSTTRPISQQS